MRRRSSLVVMELLERARQRLFEASGWQGRGGNPARHEARWDAARARVAALEQELVRVMDAERAERRP